MLAVSAAAISIPAQAKSTTKSAVVAQADPLAGDTWHAIAPSWPGTIRFDGKTKKMVLEPLGSSVIEGSYTVSDVIKRGDSTGGKLRMEDSAGNVSESNFTIIGKDMQLTFPGRQQTESYKRMTAAEAEAEKARLSQAIRDGRTKMLNGAKPTK